MFCLQIVQKHTRVPCSHAWQVVTAASCRLTFSELSSSHAWALSAVMLRQLAVLLLLAGGVSASHLDIAPRHAGVVFGVGNTAGTLAGLVAVPGLGYVLQQTGNWSLAFGLAALHNVVGAVLWACWVGDRPLPEDGGEEETKQQSVFSRTQLQPTLAVHTASTGDMELAGFKLKTA